MYLYFDKNGALKEIINNEAIRKGNSNYNKVYCYFEGGTSTFTGLYWLLKYPDGTLGNETSFTGSTYVEEGQVPIDKKRDYKYFKDYETYTFNVFTLTGSLTQNGLYSLTIRATTTDDGVGAMGMVTFNAEANVIKSDANIKQSQYDYLLGIISEFISTYIENAVPSLSNDGNGTITNENSIQLKRIDGLKNFFIQLSNILSIGASTTGQNTRIDMTPAIIQLSTSLTSNGTDNKFEILLYSDKIYVNKVVSTIGGSVSTRILTITDTNIYYKGHALLTKVNTSDIYDEAVTRDKLSQELQELLQQVLISIPDGSVTTIKIVDGAVTTAKINDGAVTTLKIDNKAVTKAKLEQTLQDLVDLLAVIIPSTATSSNKLADENYVNDQINSVSAYYITKNAQGDAFASVSELTGASTYYSGGVVRVPTRNDYAIVLDDANHDNATTRYSYQGSQWEYQYTINESPMTQPQLNALNSGITSAKVSTYDNAVANALTLAKIYGVDWKTNIDITTAKIVPDLFSGISGNEAKVGFTTTDNKNYLCDVILLYTSNDVSYYKVLFRFLGTPDANSTYSLNISANQLLGLTISYYLNSSVKFNTNQAFYGKNYYECKTNQTLGSLMLNCWNALNGEYTITNNVWQKFNVFINMGNSNIDGYYTLYFKAQNGLNGNFEVKFIKEVYDKTDNDEAYIGFASAGWIGNDATITDVYALDLKIYLPNRDELNKAYYNMGEFDYIIKQSNGVYILYKNTKSIKANSLNWTNQGSGIYTTSDLVGKATLPSNNSTIAKIGSPFPTVAWDDFVTNAPMIAMSNTGVLKVNRSFVATDDWQIQYEMSSTGSQASERKLIEIDINNPIATNPFTDEDKAKLDELDTADTDVTDTTLYKISGVADTLALPKESQVEIVKIEGNSRKCSNLLNIADKTFSSAGFLFDETPLSLKAGTYTLSFNFNGTSGPTQLSILDSNNSVIFTETFTINNGINTKTFTINNTSAKATYYVNTTGTISNVMLNEGSTALPYEEYFEGIHDADTTELESCGVNIWDEQWEVGNINNLSGANADASDRIRSKDFIKVEPNKTYYFYGGNVYSEIDIFAYDINKNFIGAFSSGSWSTAGNSSDVKNTTKQMPSNAYYLKFKALGTTTYNHDICINYSNASINGNYYPYTNDSVNVGSDVLRSAGSVRDSKVASGEITRRIGTLDLSTATATYNSAYNYWEVTLTGAKDTGSVISSNYTENDNWGFVTQNSGYVFDKVDGNKVYINNGSSTTAPTGTLYYELATPTTEQGTPFSSNALAVEMYGAEYQNGTTPLQVTKNYDISIKDQVLTNVEVDKKQSEQIKALQKLLEPTLLWQNGSPSSDFSATTVNISNLSNFKYLIFKYAQSSGGVNLTQKVECANGSFKLFGVYFPDVLYYTRRTVTISSTSVAFADCYITEIGEANSQLIPIAIYGTDIL